jgi:hypothetical protein
MCSEDTLNTYVERPYSCPPSRNADPFKLLNQRAFLEPGMHLAVIMRKKRPHDLDRTTMKSILDHSFHYTKSIDTDLRKTFARIRREQHQRTQVQEAFEKPRKVFPIKQRKRSAA